MVASTSCTERPAWSFQFWMSSATHVLMRLVEGQVVIAEWIRPSLLAASRDAHSDNIVATIYICKH